jgi:hypothetical protein
MLKNPYLRNLVASSIKIPSILSFRYNILPDCFKQMKNYIEEKCNEAFAITLIPDGWTNRQNSEYLGKF